jgi:hypothetical protein
MQSAAMPSFARRAIAAILLVVALAVGLSACGSSSGSSGTTNGTTGAQFQARLNLAKCFRSHGINVPDPSTGGGPAGGGGLFRTLQGYSRTQIQSATQACRTYFAKAFPRANLSPAQQAQFRQAFVKFAECMRSHGVNVPDPSTSGAGGFGFRGTFRSTDRNSPAFQAASKACQSLRPGRGAFGGGGGPGGPPGGGAPGA